MEKQNTRFIFLLIFMLLGIVLSIQFRSIWISNQQKVPYAYKFEETLEQLDKEKKLGEKLKESINKNMKRKEEILKSFVNSKEDGNLKLEYEAAKLKAGLTEVKGHGISIEVNDALQKKGEQEEFLVHDSDLRKILNELKKAGSQAISINNERIMATSEIVCAGPTIRINNRRYAVPFEIKAIGDPEKLYEGIDNCEIINEMRTFEIRVDIKKDNEITIPMYSGNTELLIRGLEVLEK